MFLGLAHYFQASSTSSSNDIFKKSQTTSTTRTHAHTCKTKKKNPQNKTQKTSKLYVFSGSVTAVLFLVIAMNSVKEAFQNLVHHPVENYN